MIISYIPHLLRYLGAVSAVGLSALGAALGQGSTFQGTQAAITRQETSSKSAPQLQLLGLVLIESGPALGLLFGMLLLFSDVAKLTLATGICECAAGFSLGISALCASIASGQAVVAAGEALARQPYAQKRIATLMLVLQSLTEASIVFNLIVGILIKSRLHTALTLGQATVYAAASLALSIGCIGPAIGQGIISRQSLNAVGVNQSMYNKIFSLTLLSQAFIEAPIFFAFVIALKLLYLEIPSTALWTHTIAYFGATLSSGIGAAGPAIGAAWMSGKAVLHAALYPAEYQQLFKITFLSQVIIETGVIYSLIVSFIIAGKIF